MTLLDRYDRLLDGLLQALIAQYGGRLRSVVVFGSVGRGTPREDSDVDVLIVAGDLPRGRFARVEEFERVEARLGTDLCRVAPGGPAVTLSPVFKTPEEVQAGSPLFLDMVDDARILYDADGFFAGYLDRLRRRLHELGARRIRLGNAWYWDLKPDLKPGEVFTL
ncbi:MAG: nucleotidyltransferase domain-containing protein [Candidatus Rokubacteria bacterium]|nr:nucleotidyltransferase domain-containing protein [Candidatus Rokubacteria bacterium]